MAKISTLNLKNGQTVIDGALKVLADYCAEHGLAVKQEGRWLVDRNGNYLNAKFQFVTGGEEGIDAKQKADFERQASWFGLEAQDYGAIITSRGKKYKLVGFNLKARKFPYNMVEVATGDTIRFSDMALATIIAARGK